LRRELDTPETALGLLFAEDSHGADANYYSLRDGQTAIGLSKEFEYSYRLVNGRLPNATGKKMGVDFGYQLFYA
jgi:hypothetical protein